jgi:hypothetical protein
MNHNLCPSINLYNLCNKQKCIYKCVHLFNSHHTPILFYIWGTHIFISKSSQSNYIGLEYPLQQHFRTYNTSFMGGPGRFILMFSLITHTSLCFQSVFFLKYIILQLAAQLYNFFNCKSDSEYLFLQIFLARCH